MSEVTTTPQAARKPMTVAEVSVIPNWGSLTPADQKILGLMLGPKRLSMEAALVQVYPTMSSTQVAGCVQYLLADSQVRQVLTFAGISIPGAPPAPVVVKLPTERIALAELWARREFLDLPPVLVPQAYDLSAPPMRKINTQKLFAMFFTLARRDWSAAISMTSSHFTLQEIAEIVTTISKDAAIQAVLALVAKE